MYDVLLNHEDADLASVRDVEAVLKDQRWRVLANHHFTRNRPIESEIEGALSEVKCIVTLWSAASIASPRVLDVAAEAREMSVLVSACIEPVKPPMGYRNLPAVNLAGVHSSTGYVELVSVVQAVLAGQPVSLSSEPQDTLSIRVARRVIEALRTETPSDLPPKKVASTFRLDEWHVDVGANTLSRGDETKSISPRSMELLHYLVQRVPDTVSVDDIMENVWQGRVVVDSAVHRCVSELRDALEDDHRNPKYIETFAKRGYRLVAEAKFEKKM